MFYEVTLSLPPHKTKNRPLGIYPISPSKTQGGVRVPVGRMGGDGVGPTEKLKARTADAQGEEDTVGQGCGANSVLSREEPADGDGS